MKKTKATEPTYEVFGIDRRNLNQTLRIITVWVIGLMISLWIFDKNRNFIFLLLLAWLTAIAMDPAADWLTSKGLKRGAAVGIVLVALIIFGIAFLGLFGGVLFAQAASLVDELPLIVTNAVNWINSTFDLTLSATEIQKSLNLTPDQMATWASNLAGGVVGVVTGLIGAIFQFMTMLLFAYYFAAEGTRVRRSIGRWLSPRAQEVFVTTWDIAVQKTGGFVASKLLLALVSALAHGIFFWAIGVPYWLPMAIITGIVGQFIPAIGTYLGILIPVLFTLFSTPIDALWIVIFASVYQQFENYILSPRISRKMMDIHPAVAFGSVIVFANLFGALGALIAIPVAAALVAVSDTYGRRNELIPRLHDLNN